MNGTPYVQVNMNHGVYDNPYGFSIYHTKNDNEETYDAGALQYHMAFTTSYLVRTDKLPAQQMDFKLRIKELRKVIADESIYKKADVKAYKVAADFSRDTSVEWVNTVNCKYEQDTWTYGRQTGAVNVVGSTYDVLHEDGPYKAQIREFKNAKSEMKGSANYYIKREIKALNNMAEYMGY